MVGGRKVEKQRVCGNELIVSDQKSGNDEARLTVGG